MSALVSMPDDALMVAARETPSGPAASTRPLAFGTAVGKDEPSEAGEPAVAVATLPPSAPADAQDFSARIHLLIERAGGAGALARCCGVTERTVRNWCHGRGDISRDRCLVLARALRVSPLWLITGEGCMTGGPAKHSPPVVEAPDRRSSVDSERLAAALQVLQSYIVLAGGSLSIAQRAEAVVELYGLLAQPGPSDAERLIAFHKMLAAYLRSNRQALIT